MDHVHGETNSQDFRLKERARDFSRTRRITGDFYVNTQCICFKHMGRQMLEAPATKEFVKARNVHALLVQSTL